ncbi:hypothetical protein LCGC14_0981220 [marine sediment metagenome]|uniref:DUF559 domain-containing protein n=1 Tax=marine sediment metagenome TaxID=412755 RepID=A0A0F9ND32_9ZZZZ
MKFEKGYIPWNKGLTKDTDIRVTVVAEKISRSLKGRIRPIEETMKAAESNRGKKRSDEARRNISIGHLGQPGWNTGLKSCYSEEALEKMSIAKIGNTCHKGQNQSEKTKREHSHKMKKMWADKNSIFNSPDFLKERARAQNILPNKPETFLIDLIEKNKLPFKYVGDGSFIIERKNPDFVNINGKKQVIEFFGEYWHQGEEPQDRIDLFAKYGFSTLVIWERELKEPEKVLTRLKEFAGESIH